MKFNLIRQKSDNYKSKQPEAINKIIAAENGEKVMVADFEMFYEDYPFNIPVILYDIDSPHVLEPDMPFISIKKELWGVKGFIQISETEINIHCVYCGMSTIPMVNPSKALQKT
jgi:hypothetical protein